MGRIYLDTNTFFRNGFFRAGAAQALFGACRVAGYEVIIPETVLDEVRGNYAKELTNAVQKLSTAEKNIQKWTDLDDTLVDDSRAVQSFSASLDAMIEKYDIRRLPYSEKSTQDVVVASYSGRKPFDVSGNGYKDFLIWDVIRADMLAKPDAGPFVFVSFDKGDYGRKKGGETNSRTFILHPDIAEGVADLDGKLTCYNEFGHVVEDLVLPNLAQATPETMENATNAIPQMVEDMIDEHLGFREMYGLQGLPFSNDVTLNGYGDLQIAQQKFYRFEDDIMVRILASVEGHFTGYMDKWDYLSKDWNGEISGSLINDHVFEVEGAADVVFEITAIYSQAAEAFQGNTFHVLNEIEDEFY